MKIKEFKAPKSKISQMIILYPLCAAAALAYIYISKGHVSLIEAIPLGVVATAFAWLGNRLKKTPYFAVDSSYFYINNVFTGKKTIIPFSEIEKASIAMNILKIQKKGESRPHQIAIGMLSKNDKEAVRKIFLPASS